MYNSLYPLKHSPPHLHRIWYNVEFSPSSFKDQKLHVVKLETYLDAQVGLCLSPCTYLYTTVSPSTEGPFFINYIVNY